MRPRSLLVGAVAAAGAALAWRRRRMRSYVELQFDDGSLVRLERGTAADDLLALTRRAVREARAA